jgi:hypothetical protein
MLGAVRLFLLSPANMSGIRAGYLLRDTASFPLAARLRDGGAPLGEVMSFASGLYFRGKEAYARAFVRPTRDAPGVFVVTSNRGLVPLDEIVTVRDLRRLATGDIDAADPRYRRPLVRDVRRLAAGAEVVLLGSIASDKYVAVLCGELGERLLFPPAFVGRGDMSRGGLLLRCVDEGRELDYAPVAGAIRHGARPPRLPPRKAVLDGAEPERERQARRAVAPRVGLDAGVLGSPLRALRR